LNQSNQLNQLNQFHAITELVKPESIMKVLENRIPAGFLEMNRKALDIGLELGAAVMA
jgi:Pyruvate/2-oxoacid:ferredoxin oxidoreductase gamma subunit